MARKKVISEEINEMRTSNKVEKNEDTYVEQNLMDSLPDVIDKDYGFFLMFGEPDYPLPGTPTNFGAVMSVPKF